MFTLHQSGPTGGDETATYLVQFGDHTGQHTIKDFVESLVKDHSGDHGIIHIRDAMHLASDIDAGVYSHGKFEKPIDEELMDKVINSITAAGGWGRMDYMIYITGELKRFEYTKLGDSPYKKVDHFQVELDKDYTVSEFISKVITTEPHNWGSFIMEYAQKLQDCVSYGRGLCDRDLRDGIGDIPVASVHMMQNALYNDGRYDYVIRLSEGV